MDLIEFDYKYISLIYGNTYMLKNVNPLTGNLRAYHAKWDLLGTLCTYRARVL